MGHLGVEKVEELSRQRFYWPYMKKDIEFHITKKCACIADKAPVVYENAPLFPVVASEPFEMVSIDFLKLDVCKGSSNMSSLSQTTSQGLPKPMQPRTNPAKRRQTSSLTNSYCNLGFPNVSTMTGSPDSIVNCLKSCTVLLE